MADKPVISVVIPLYNEEENIRPLYERLKNVLEDVRLPFEIICVNDGSTDRSLDLLLELRATDRRLKILDFSRNFGKEIALTAGIDFAQGDAVIMMDADLQHPPEMIPEMIAKWKEGYDVVVPVHERSHQGLLRRLLSRLFYKIAGRVMSVRLEDGAGDFRLLSKKVVDVIRKMRERNRFMKGIYAWAGFRSCTIPYKLDPRYAGRTKWGFFKLLNFAFEAITSFSYVPLQIAMYFGFFVAILSFLFGLWIVIQTLYHGRVVPGYASIITVSLFLGGVQLICIGVLGEYVGRIYTEVKSRPLYVINRMWGITEEDEKR